MERIDPREPFLRTATVCPDCQQDWTDGPSCPHCGLSLQDMEDAADYFDNLPPGGFVDSMGSNC